MRSMPASRAAASILAGSRPPRPRTPASINSDSPLGVTIESGFPPSTSMKKISSVLADAGRTSARQKRHRHQHIFRHGGDDHSG